MDSYFAGKKVIVTGAGRGIGRDLCKALASLGAKVIAISRTLEHLESLKSEEPSIEIHAQDISQWDNTRKLIEEIGLVDMLVNNAAASTPKPMLDITEDNYDIVFNTNVKAAFNISQVRSTCRVLCSLDEFGSALKEFVNLKEVVVKAMIEKKTNGAIVNVSSVAAMGPVSSLSVYSCSKAALDMMTKSMALEFGPHQIRVNSVNPTVVKTELGKDYWSKPDVAEPLLKRIPNGRFAEIEDVVNAIVFLLSDKASMINGILMPVDGGHIIQFM